MNLNMKIVLLYMLGFFKKFSRLSRDHISSLQISVNLMRDKINKGNNKNISRILYRLYLRNVQYFNISVGIPVDTHIDKNLPGTSIKLCKKDFANQKCS